MAPVSRVRSTPPPRLLRRAWAAALLSALLLAVACVGETDTDDDGERPPELAGWRRGGVHGHADVLAYDRVAVADDPESLAWLTWARGVDRHLSAYVWVPGGATVETQLAMPDVSSLPLGSTADGTEPVVMADAIAVDGTSWTAVAAVRNAPDEQTNAFVAWQGDTESTAGDEQVAPALLEPPEGTRPGAPGAAVRSGDATVVAALTTDIVADDPAGYAPVTGLATWTSTGGAPWEVAAPDLGLDTPLVSIGLAGDNTRIILAGVTDDGRAHLWTSSDGKAWTAVDQGLPDEVAEVDVVTAAADGTVAVAWHPRDADSERLEADRSASLLHTLTAGGLVDRGAVAFADDVDLERVDIQGVVEVADERLVLAGAGHPGTGYEPVPVVWAQDGDDWAATAQPQLVGRLDFEMRGLAMATDRDGDGTGLRAIVTGWGVDVEQWEWHGGA